ncbi:MAG: hypothetical protein IKN24_01010 [Lachnospiraceae bacterium]|nr:hypothetical protein [Lachnospiraceae bacterium]
MSETKSVSGIWILIIAVILSIASCEIVRNGQNAPDPIDTDLVDYYGCPNSKRVKKLNLRKR